MSTITTEIFNQKMLEVLLAHNKEFTERLIENNHKQTFFEITNKSDHGDLTTNFAMMHAKSLKMNPVKLAEILVNGFKLAGVEVAFNEKGEYAICMGTI